MADSDLERKVLYCLLANRRLRRVRDQWPKVEFQDVAGEGHTHTFDFWTSDWDGFRTAVAVRPKSLVAKAKPGQLSLFERLQLIRPADLAPFADRWVIYTEEDVSDAVVRNARNLLWARKHRHEGDYQEALAYVEPICGSVLFYDLLSGAQFPAYRRIALWCLIDDGILFPVNQGRIVDRSPMRVNRDLIQHIRRAA